MTTKTIIMIVPRLPPAIDGLGDYGLHLAKELQLEFGITTRFVLGDPNWKGPQNVDGFSVKKIKSRSSKELVNLLQEEQAFSNTFILNYVGYGYAKRGCPFWLVRSIQQWRKQNEKLQLITMLHELYAMGPIWNSQFWTSWMQRKIVKDLINLSTKCVTSNNNYAKTIRRYSTQKNISEVSILPVFSNVGEPQSLNSLSDRPRRMVIFGTKIWRDRVYQKSLPYLEKFCKQMNIKEIIDIGAILNYKLPSINGVDVQSLGIVSKEKISEVLSQSQIGAFYYPNASLCKSGIFAAYCSHKVLPVGLWDELQPANGINTFEEYWPLDAKEEINMEKAQRIADQAHAWYQTHTLSAHAQLFNNLFEFN